MKKIIWLVIIASIVWLGGRSLFGAILSRAQNSATLYTVTHPQTVCLDPGHGGLDSGAVNGPLTEADINLQVGLKARALLWKKGYRVFMTRVADRTLLNADRYNFCNQSQATIMVSIHQNYFDDPAVNYSTALEYKPQDAALAQSLAEAVSQKLNLSLTAPQEFDGGVLISSTMPASIVESAFITNPTEARALSDSSARLSAQAEGITNGIEAYFATQGPTSGSAASAH